MKNEKEGAESFVYILKQSKKRLLAIKTQTLPTCYRERTAGTRFPSWHIATWADTVRPSKRRRQQLVDLLESQSVTLSSSARETGPEQGLHHIVLCVCYIGKRRSKLFSWPLWFEVWPFFMCGVINVKF